jgi:phosphotransferase system HPr (HPr) family protein
VAACLAELVRDHRIRAGITAGGQHADLGSIVEVLSLGIARGTEVVLTVEGKKSADVLARIKQVLEERKES